MTKMTQNMGGLMPVTIIDQRLGSFENLSNDPIIRNHENYNPLMIIIIQDHDDYCAKLLKLSSSMIMMIIKNEWSYK